MEVGRLAWLVGLLALACGKAEGEGAGASGMEGGASGEGGASAMDAGASEGGAAGVGGASGGAGGSGAAGAGGVATGGAGGAVSVDAGTGDCILAFRLDECCNSPVAASRDEVAADLCLVEYVPGAPLYQAVPDDVLRECTGRQPEFCQVVDCAIGEAPRLVEQAADGQCVLVDECSGASDCVFATDHRRCCSCPLVVPKVLADRDACLESPPVAGWECADCSAVRCAACPEDDSVPICDTLPDGFRVCAAAPPTANVRYRAAFYNGIDSGDFAMVTRADFAEDTCAVIDVFFMVGAPAPLTTASIRQGAASCCPLDVVLERSPCLTTGAGCPGWVEASRDSGTIACTGMPGAPCALDIDYTAEFPPAQPWAPAAVHFDVMGLATDDSCAP